MYKISKINYVAKVLERQQQIINYLQEYQWSSSQMEIQTSLKKNLLQSQIKQMSLKINQLAHSYIRRSLTRDQMSKLKNASKIMQSVSANLKDITQQLQQVYKITSQSACFYEKSKTDYLNRLSNISEGMNQSIYREGYQLKIYDDLYFYIHNCFFMESFRDILQKSCKKIALYLLQVQTKLSLLPLLAQDLPNFQPDITVYYPNDPKYFRVWKRIKFMTHKCNKQLIQNQIQNFRKIMMATTAAVVTQSSSTELLLLQKIIFGTSFPIFLLANDQSHLRCYKIWRNPVIGNVNKIWNLPESGIFLYGQHVLFPFIQTCFFIYVPVTYGKSHSQNKANHNNIQFQQQQFPQIFKQKPEEESIRVLVLCHQKLIYNEMIKKPMCLPSYQQFNKVQSFETIMIFMAGGGFVSLSSETAQSFTRKWANSLKIPIFSIDYRKAPKYRYPTAVEDCLTAYQFIIQKICNYFNVKPKNIILAGDSSGGNLAIGLHALLLQKKYSVLPTGIFLAYPATDLRLRFSPSRIFSFKEPLLMPTLLKLCMDEYLGKDKINQNNPFASPILLTQHFIRTGKPPPPQAQKDQTQWPRNWPKTTIMVGKKDPLYDDSLRLLQRMCEVGVDGKLLIYSQFSHAFLGMGSIIQESNTAINDAIQQIKNLIKQ